MLNKGRSGSNKAAVLSVLVDSWFANPLKDRSSVHVDGEGNSVMTSVIVKSTLYPSDDSWSPANVACLRLNFV